MKEKDIERLREIRKNHLHYGGIGLIASSIVMGIVILLSDLGVISGLSDWIIALWWGVFDYLFFGIYFLWLSREMKKTLTKD